MSALKRLVPYLFPVLLSLVSLPVWADGIPRNEVSLPQSMSTIWVLGDLEPVARALTWCALLFNSNSGSFAMGMMQVGVVFAVLFAVINVTTTGQLLTLRNLMMVFVFIICLGPSTTMYVANSYDSNGLRNSGAVRFKQVDNVPFAIGLALGTFSHLSHVLTDKIDTVTQTIPDANWTGNPAATGALAGGMNLYGNQGVFSPLKTLIGLRRVFAQGGNPLITANMARAARDCRTWRNRWDETRTKGFLNVLTAQQQAGETSIWVGADNDGGKRILTQMNCADAGKIIAAQSLAMTTPKPGKTTSDAAEILNVAQSTNISGLSNTTGQRAALVQSELDQLPTAAATAAGGSSSANENPHTLLAFAYQRASSQGGRFNPNEMAQFFTAGVAVDAASIQSTLILHHIANRCIGQGDTGCERAELMLGEALTTTAVDAAGEASSWANTYEKFTNFMMAFFVLFTVVMAPIVVVKGVKSFAILGMYLVLALWLFLIPPIQAGVGHFLQSALADELYNLVLEMVGSGNSLAVLSPQFTTRVFEEINKTILTGSTIMSSVSGLALLLLLGSPYVFSQIASRAGMVGQNAINEQTEAPRLDQSQVIGSNQMIEQSSMGGPLMDAQRVMGNAEARAGHAINLSSSQGMTEAAQTSLARRMSMVDADSRSVQWAQVDSNGITTSEGMTLSQNKDGSLSWNYSQKGDQILKDSEQYAIAATGEAGINGSVGLQAFGTGAKATAAGGLSASKKGSVDNSVSYTDSNGQTHSMNTSTSLADVQSLNSSFGSMDSNNISQAFSQTVSDMRDDQKSLSTAANSTVVGGAQASIDARHLAQIGLNDDRDSAMNQVALATREAAKYNNGVADAIRNAVDRGGNLGADVFQPLHSASSSGSVAERMAATAALKAIYETSDAPAAEPYAAMLESRMDVLNYTQSINANNRAAIDSPINSADAQGVGRFGSPLDTGRLNGIENRLSVGRSASDNQGRTIRDHETVMRHNMEARQKDMQEIMEINKSLRERAPSVKLADNLLSNTAETLGELKKGNYDVLLKNHPGSLGLGSQAGTDYESGKNFALNPDTLSMMERKVELEERVKNYDPNDTTKTYDGASIESVLGHAPSKQHGGPRIDTSDVPAAPPAAMNTGSDSMTAIKQLMVKGEGNYNSVNLGQRHGSRAASRNLTNMTVAEIQQAQSRREFNAVGKYQIIRNTFADGVKTLGLKGHEKFTPQLQERFFHDYLMKKAGGGDALAYINGRHNNLDRAMVAMAKEWASFPVPYDMQGHVQPVKAGQSFYHGVQGNRAHLKVNEVRAAIVAARNGGKA